MSLRTGIEGGAETVAKVRYDKALTDLERRRTGMVFEPGRLHQADPYPHYAEFREHDPVHQFPRFDGVVLTRYSDCLDVLRDVRFLTDARALRQIEIVKAGHERAGGDPKDFDNPSMLNLDGAPHARLRRLVSKGFTPRQIATLEPRIEGIAEELLDRLRPGTDFDLMQSLAHPVPAIVIAEMLGVPKEDRARFQAWSTAIVAGGATETREKRRRGVEASRALRRYFCDIVEVLRADPQGDILSALIQVEEEDGDRLKLAELISTCSLLLIAGHATTSAMIGNGTLALLRNPEQQALLRSNPQLWPSAVEEMLRYDGAIHSTVRIAKHELRIHGKPIKKGQTALLMLAAANRDPEVFADPDHFDITRSPNDHLSFGQGQHFCLGAALARLELRIALRALLERFPKLELTKPEVDWARGGIRAAIALDLRGSVV